MSQTLHRGLLVVELLGERPRRIAEIAEELEVHHSTALRLLHTLRSEGFVHQEDDGRYRLGSSMFRLAHHALERLDVRDLARPDMERLSQQCGETVHLGILEDRQVVYIEKVEARHPVRMYSRIGAVAPLHCTGLAKAILMRLDPERRTQLLHDHVFTAYTEVTHTSPESLLADLEQSFERGYTRDDQEHEPGIHCVAAPVLTADGRPAAAVSISAPTSRVSTQTLLGHVPNLLAATRSISGQLGWEHDGQPAANPAPRACSSGTPR